MTKKGANSSAKKEESPLQQQNQNQGFSLYALLQLEKGAQSTPDEIKKQYRKLVIKYHPDKNQGDETSREKFHKLKEAYDILIDEQKRKIYDQTGSIGEQFNENAFQSAYQYYRQIYKKIEKEDIEEFSKRYRQSQMEEQDLIDFYESHSGNMTTLLECIPLSRNEDIERFIEYFQLKIEAKELKKFKIFQKTKDKVRLLKDETEEFEKQEQQKKQKKGMDDLILAIRNKSNNTFLDALQKKYAQPTKKKVEKSPKGLQKKVKKAKK